MPEIISNPTYIAAISNGRVLYARHEKDDSLFISVTEKGNSLFASPVKISDLIEMILYCEQKGFIKEKKEKKGKPVEKQRTRPDCVYYEYGLTAPAEFGPLCKFHDSFFTWRNEYVTPNCPTCPHYIKNEERR